jgi:hypothetical protein
MSKVHGYLVSLCGLEALCSAGFAGHLVSLIGLGSCWGAGCWLWLDPT